MRNPFVVMNEAIFHALDTAGLWLWDRFEIHPKWVFRALMILSVSLMLFALAVKGSWWGFGIIAAVGGLLIPTFDRMFYRMPTKDRNLISLTHRTTAVAIAIKTGYFLLCPFSDLLGLLFLGGGWMQGIDLLSSTLWLVWLYWVEIIIPQKPPRRKVKLALPKLKGIRIPMPGLEPSGVKSGV